MSQYLWVFFASVFSLLLAVILLHWKRLAKPGKEPQRRMEALMREELARDCPDAKALERKLEDAAKGFTMKYGQGRKANLKTMKLHPRALTLMNATQMSFDIHMQDRKRLS